LIAEITKASQNFRRYYRKELFSFITGRRLQSSLRSTTLSNFKPETFKGQELKIVHISEEAKARIFPDT
jgi:hypothetical protein